MSRGKIRVTAAVLAVFLCRCGFDLAGGGGSQTTNSVTCCVVTWGNKPVSDATVKLIDTKNWAYLVANNLSPVLDSTKTDSNGYFTFNNMPDNTCNLQVDHPEGGAVIRHFSSGSTTPFDTVVLQKYAVVKGSCTADEGSAETVEFEGTAYRAAVGSDQTFNIPGVSPGSYPLLFGTGSGAMAIGKTLSLLAGQTVNAGSIPVAFGTLLVDDFKDGDIFSIPGRITGGFWYSFVDTLDGGSSWISHKITSDSATGENYISASATLVDRSRGAWAGVGVTMGWCCGEFDLGSVTGISFRARGRGIIRVSIESALVDSINLWPHFGFIITLDSN
ncbi:MAG TPA: hypothetical protein PLE24_05225, partial [Chitinispirillaceae bacterium]|nr:hypothetical protein [Chitinispirillaceae bacterium]